MSNTNVVMGLGQKFWPGLGQVFVAWVGSGQPFMVRYWVWKISPKSIKFFNFFTFGSKKNLFGSGQKVPRSKAGQTLIYCGSKVSSGRVGSRPISKRTWWIWQHQGPFIHSSYIWLIHYLYMRINFIRHFTN